MARLPHVRGPTTAGCAVTRGPFRSCRSIWAQRAENRGQRRVKSGFGVRTGWLAGQKECRTGNGNRIEVHHSLRPPFCFLCHGLSRHPVCRRRERCTYLCRHSTTCAFHMYFLPLPPSLPPSLPRSVRPSVRPQEPHKLGFAPGYSRS